MRAPGFKGSGLAGLWALVAAAPLLAAVRLASRGWYPAGDHAQAELRIRDFWSHPPQLGAAGRLGTLAEQGSHPGPAAWWLMYPVYALGGRSSGSLSIAVAVAAALWLGCALWFARKIGGAAFAVALAAAMLVLIRALDTATFVEPWNPWFAPLPFLVTMLAAGITVRFPVLGTAGVVIAGSFAVQAHVGFAPVVAAMAAVGVIGVIRYCRARMNYLLLVVCLGGGALAAAAMWALPLRQQLTSEPGNISLLVETFTDSNTEPIGLLAGLRATTDLLSPLGPWLQQDLLLVDASAINLSGIAAIACWAATSIAVGRSPRVSNENTPLWSQLQLVVGVGILATALAVSRIYGDLFTYVMLFGPTLMALMVATTLWNCWLLTTTGAVESPLSSVVESARRHRLVGIPVAAIVALTFLFGVTVASFFSPETPGEQYSRATEKLSTEAKATIDENDSVLIRYNDTISLGSTAFGVLLELEKSGYDVGVTAADRVPARPHRVMEPSLADTSLWVVTGTAIERFRDDPQMTEIGAFDPRRSETERSLVETAQAGVQDRLTDIGRTDLAELFVDNYWAATTDPDFPDDLDDEMTLLFELGLPSAIFIAEPTAELR